MLLGGSAAFAAPTIALADTQSDLDEAQKKLDEAQAQIDEISDQYEELSKKQSDTLDAIEAKQGEIDQTQQDIEDKEKELADKKDALAKRVSETYKSGGTNLLSILFSSSSFQELTSNIYYADKIATADKQMIDDVSAAKADLDQHKITLESEKNDLQALSDTQKQQLKEMQEKQIDVQNIINGLSQDVKDLMAKRDAELEAMAAEKARQEAAAKAVAEEAAKTSNQNSQSTPSASSGVSGSSSSNTNDTSNLSGSASKVIAACHRVPSPGGGLCAMWVSQVFYSAGFSYASGNANDMYNAWCTSSNRANLKPGMIIAVSSHPYTTAGRIYGHIGIYVGNNTVMDNIGYIRTTTVDAWVSYYGAIVTPRWGWLMGIQLG